MEDIGLDSAANETNKKQKSVKRLQCCVAILLTIGCFLTISACFIPTLLNNFMVTQAETMSALTPENEDKWMGVPGENNLTYYLKHYVYNCTNIEDVIFRNAKPNYTELGPFTYKEIDTYQNITYG